MGREARASVAVMRLWEPHDPGRWSLFYTIPRNVTNQTNFQHAAALDWRMAPSGEWSGRAGWCALRE